MVEPEIYEFLDWITRVADRHGLTLLPEVHDRYATHDQLAMRGYWTYDFVLPGLVLDALHTGRSKTLATHLAASPDRQFTTLDCHDGIPVRPDLDGILEPEALRDLAARTVARGGNVNHILSSANPAELDVHQLNCTYYSALERDDDRYVAARAIQLFARGVPQIYYVGLLAGENDRTAVARTGEGRAINRHDYTRDELNLALARPVVKRLIELIRLRNTHPAFDGELEVENPNPRELWLRWHDSDAMCSLHVDLETGSVSVEDRLAS
jgi:sucrose phosphorylase